MPCVAREILLKETFQQCSSPSFVKPQQKSRTFTPENKTISLTITLKTMIPFKKVCLMLICALAVQITSWAQQVQVSPVPQSVTWGEKAFTSAEAKYTLTKSETTDAYAVALLQENLTLVNEGGIHITLGKKGEAAVSAVEANIPQTAEGYYLKVTADGIVVAGTDDAGTYYGVQTLLQILAQPEVMAVEIKDYPACAQRGVIEGFYGNPWSDADRKSQFDFYGKNKMNIYVYGPKDDPYHRTKWRENYPEDKAAIIRGLAEAAKKNHVSFVWSIHTGGSISNSEADFKAVVKKLEHVYSLGVRNFSIFFDDFGGADADLQVAECNYVWKNFIEKHDDLDRLSMCPTKYNAAYANWNQNDAYLRGLGNGLHKGIEVMWTGAGVADMINQGDLDFFKTATNGMAPFIWLNYPVNDYCIGHMLMGKFYGNDQGDNAFGGKMTAFTSNPMEYAEASKVALYGVADYAWNMKDYNPEANWERAIKYLMPNNAEAYHVFCEHNVDLGWTVHGMRREGESPNFNADGTLAEKKAQFDLMVTSADALLADTYNPALITEITPWLQKMKYMGQRGQKIVEMWGCIESGDTATFLQDYRDIQAILLKEDALTSRDFAGTIKMAKPVVASQKIEPYLKQQVNELIIAYKERYTEGWENFPMQVLESGTYYIKYNGKYLYNKDASADRTGDFPIWADEVDDAQPQKCEWNISIDAQTGRYKITNAQDGRYLNENGQFWANKVTNAYDGEWNSYNIFRVNGMYAIQTPSKAKNYFMGANDNRIISNNKPLSIAKDKTPILHINDAIFEIVPVKGNNTEHPTIVSGKRYYVKNAKGEYLTTTAALTAWSRPTFQAKAQTESKRQYQQWTITIDDNSGRWKISFNDSKFLDEEGRINKNAYFSEWNSVIMNEVGGHWAIQSVTPEANPRTWGVTTDNNINYADTELKDSYVFTIADVAAEDLVSSISAPVISPAPKSDTSIYDLSGRKVKRIAKHGVYIKSGKKIVR